MTLNSQHPEKNQAASLKETTDGDVIACHKGTLNEGLCYFITLLLKNSLTSEEQASFAEKKKQLVALLSEAGLRGAKSKMKEYSAQLQNLFLQDIDPILNKGSQATDTLISTWDQWCALLGSTQGCFPIDLAIRGNHLHMLIRWSGEISPDEQIDNWKNHFPTIAWDDTTYFTQVAENDLDKYTHFIATERGLHSAPIFTHTEIRTSTPTDEIAFHHLTVLLEETVDALLPAPGKVIIDATLGGGGHTELLLERGATVIGIDQDPDARQAAAKRLERFRGQFHILSGNFREVADLLKKEGIEKIDGLLADIGVSSHQIDTPERGFSFRENGPLDMRMSPDLPLSAADIVATADEDELIRIFREYGEERASRAMARLIIKTREQAPITTTAQLAALAEKAIPRRSGHHPGTKIFQALRICVNDELGALEDLLRQSIDLLNIEGRLAIITFHSLEDRCVKRFMERHSREEIDRPEWPAPRPNPEYHFRLINKRPIVASEQEIKINPRSRSAKLRVAQKIN